MRVHVPPRKLLAKSVCVSNRRIKYIIAAVPTKYDIKLRIISHYRGIFMGSITATGRRTADAHTDSHEHRTAYVYPLQ